MSEEFDNQNIDTDNSENVSEEPQETGDNSENTTQEPVENNDSSNNADKEAAGKFQDLETANKSYSELEKKFGEQSNELGNLRKLNDEFNSFKDRQAKFLSTLGYDSIESFENHQRELQYDEDVSKFEVNQYLEHLNECEYPDEVKKLVALYHSSKPEDKQAVLDSIESNFPVNAIKKVAEDVAAYKGQLDFQKRQALENQQLNLARSYLQDVTTKYQDEFKNEKFTKLYGEAFRALGLDLNSDYFMQLAMDLKKSWQNEALKAHNIKLENDEATNRISDSFRNNAGTSSKDVLDMSESEIVKELAKFKK